MQILDLRTLSATVLVLASTGCASLQSSVPQDDTLRITQEEIDYIDDRFSGESAEVVLPGADSTPQGLVDGEDLDEARTIDESIRDEDFRDVERERLTDDRLRQMTLFAGYRNFTDDDLWDRVDAETTLGIEYAHEVKDGLGFEVGGLGSLGTQDGVAGDVDVTGAAAEFYGGARYFFRGDRRWTPYVGGGLSAILAGVDNDAGGQVTDDQDFSLGLYAHGGVQYELNRLMYLGVDLRALFGTDLELQTTTGDADYVQLGFTLGFRL